MVLHQEDLLDLITTLLNFNCFLSTTVAMQCTFLRVSWLSVEQEAKISLYDFGGKFLRKIKTLVVRGIVWDY